MWPASPCSALISPTFWAQRARWLSRARIWPSMPSISLRTASKACIRASLMGSTVAAGKIVHEIRQRLHGSQRNGVVDRGPHAADRLVPLERGQAGRLALGQEGRIEPAVGQHERHVHARAAIRIDRVGIEAARLLDAVVEATGLGDIDS